MNVDKLFFNHATTKSVVAADVNAISVLADAFVRISGMSVFAIDFDEHKLIYQSDKLIYLDETTLDDIKRECANPYWSLISEETLNHLLDIREHSLLADIDIPLDEYKSHVCTIDYPISIRNHELFITQRFTPLVMREDGITKVGMFAICSSNKKEIESTITTSSGKRFRYDFDTKQFVNQIIATTLTPTEKAVLHRVKMGMTNGEIAKSLYITINTVKTHRTHIFKKLQVRTINEAIVLAENNHLI